MKIKKALSTLNYNNISTILIVFGIFLIGCIWVTLYHKIDNEKEIEINNAIKVTTNLAYAFEEHMSRTINSADQAVLFLKYQYEKEGQSINIPQYIKEGRFANLPFVLMGIINENGDLILCSQAPFVPSNLKDREHFRVHQNTNSGNLFISKPVLGRSSGKWSIQFTRRINKPDGEFGGVAFVSVDPFYFTEFYRRLNLGKNSSITLVGQDGIVRARLSNENAEMGQALNNGNLMEMLQSNEDGFFILESPIDGIERIYSFRALRNHPLAVVVGVDKNIILKSLNDRINSYYKIAGLITIVVFMFIIVLLRITLTQNHVKEKLKKAHDKMEAQVNLRTQELIQKNEDIRKMAYLDMLTGLPNRAYLKEKLESEMVKARLGESSGLVIFIDLDELKSVNDVYGHTWGDKLICTAASLITDVVGKDALVSRLGGDEFVVLIPGKTDRKQSTDIANQIMRSLGFKFEVSGDIFFVSASIGLALYPTDGDTAEEILKNADTAMYAAKKAGKKCWRFFEKAMQIEASEKILLTSSLRLAIERNELLLNYQPQVDTVSRSIIGFEALLRWNSPEYGVVPPERFVPFTEQSGLILPIGKWVIRQACQFVRKLSDKGLPEIYVAVNISPLQLTSDDFIDIVRNELQEANIKPCQLELEITENVLIASMEDSIKKLNQLRALGVGVSLDDFGTGYSSLTYLRSLPVGTVKIDKSFIDMIAKDKVQEQVIGGIIQMAHILNIQVLAEGVENDQQLEYLVKNKCDKVQGFLISPPVPEINAIEILMGLNYHKIDGPRQR